MSRQRSVKDLLSLTATDDPLYAIRRVLRRGAEHLSEHAWTRLLSGLDAGDVDEQIGVIWIAAKTQTDLRLGQPRGSPGPSLRMVIHCADSGVPELRRLATTIDS